MLNLDSKLVLRYFCLVLGYNLHFKARTRDDRQVHRNCLPFQGTWDDPRILVGCCCSIISCFLSTFVLTIVCLFLFLSFVGNCIVCCGLLNYWYFQTFPNNLMLWGYLCHSSRTLSICRIFCLIVTKANWIRYLIIWHMSVVILDI